MIAILAAGMLAAAEPASAAAAAPAASAAAPAPAATAAKAKSRRDEKVCWDEASTGTLIPRRYCATRGELEDRRQHDQDWKMNFHQAPQAGN